MSFFPDVDTIRYRGPESTDPLSFRYYDANAEVLGRTMKEHLRFAVCYWHSFDAPGSDVFGAGTWDRPWANGNADPMEAAREKLAAGFEFIAKLTAPYFCFHDRDVAPEGATLDEAERNLFTIGEDMAREMARTGTKLLWGTANLFGHPRYAAGAATNPNPEVFAHAAAQVKTALELTHQLGGENYVLWGGREGYDTLLNTDLKRESDQLGRFMQMVVDYKHKIGFTGTLLIEPETLRAHQASVRLRRGRVLRIPAEVRPDRRVQAQHRMQPRDTRRPHLPARSCLRHRARHLRQRPMPTAVIPRTAGTPTSTRTASRKRPWCSTKSCARAASPAAGFNFDAKLRRPKRCPGGSLLRPYRRHGHPGTRIAECRGVAAIRRTVQARRESLFGLGRCPRAEHPERPDGLRRLGWSRP